MIMRRKAIVSRKTKETSIVISLNLDGNGIAKIKTPINFFTHMLEAFCKHGLFEMKAMIDGDIKVDQHHIIEDAGIVLGKAFKEALGDMKGINRSGFFAFPMDEALSLVAIDIGGRPYVTLKSRFKRRMCGDFDTDLTKHFFESFANALGANITINIAQGELDHHKIESLFKAFAKALKMAVSVDPRAKNIIPSTKGIIEY